jgi:hypothetical protein
LLIVTGLFDPGTFRGQFWPFVDVLRVIWLGVTRKIVAIFAIALEGGVFT